MQIFISQRLIAQQYQNSTNRIQIYDGIVVSIFFFHTPLRYRKPPRPAAHHQVIGDTHQSPQYPHRQENKNAKPIRVMTSLMPIQMVIFTSPTARSML